jgi:HTH-type transcriptional regulator, sugar sensing transcriptional regulator
MDLNQYLDTLNLNSYEKNIVSYLTTVNDGSAHKIYIGTKVPKGRIYSVLNSLVEKGFVNIIPTSPKKYKIEDVKESIKKFLHSEKLVINKKVEDIKDIELKPKIFELEKTSPSVYTLTGREEHLSAQISLRNRAKEGMIQIGPLFVGTFASNLSLYKALERGVKLRAITRKITPSNRKKILKCLELGAEIRVLDSHDLVSVLVRDSKEFLLGLDDHTNQEERLNIYSNNKAVLKVLEDTFERFWKKAKSPKRI